MVRGAYQRRIFSVAVGPNLQVHYMASPQRKGYPKHLNHSPHSSLNHFLFILAEYKANVALISFCPILSRFCPPNIVEVRVVEVTNWSNLLLLTRNLTWPYLCLTTTSSDTTLKCEPVMR